MTGLSFRDDLILEVAAIITDWEFNEVASYHGIVKHQPTRLAERFSISAPFWDQHPKTRDALIGQNDNGKELKRIESELIAFAKKHIGTEKPILSAGNSVHVDRRFILENWPRFEAMLHYRMLDVSAWKVVFNRKFEKQFVKPGNHRALDDVRGSISELKFYLSKLR
ncbi:oligoribonuclease [Candidatus Saccharibacteria bacterium]|nr:oligoribonuclease [Candidatus Saccharibacteria bacterium]